MMSENIAPDLREESIHLAFQGAKFNPVAGEMSQKLLDNKLKALTVENPVRIVTANIGCQLHLESKADVPVNHWIELLDR